MKALTFEDLANKSTQELEKIRDRLKDDLAEIMQGKFQLAASIMFYQSEIEKERRHYASLDQPATTGA